MQSPIPKTVDRTARTLRHACPLRALWPKRPLADEATVRSREGRWSCKRRGVRLAADPSYCRGEAASSKAAPSPGSALATPPREGGPAQPALLASLRGPEGPCRGERTSEATTPRRWQAARPGPSRPCWKPAADLMTRGPPSPPPRPLISRPRRCKPECVPTVAPVHLTRDRRRRLGASLLGKTLTAQHRRGAPDGGAALTETPRVE
jgi:hypothetical protein